MFRSLKEMFGYKIRALDGRIGYVHDFLFVDKSWSLKYLVAGIKSAFNKRYILVCAQDLNSPDWDKKEFSIELSIRQIKSGTDISQKKPVSQKYEELFKEYYETYPIYPMGITYFHNMTPLVLYLRDSMYVEHKYKRKKNEFLRSVKEVRKYGLFAPNSSHKNKIDDFIIDDQNWKIKHLVVKTGWKLLGGKKVKISPFHIQKISWFEHRIYCDLSQTQINSSPELKSEAPVDRNYEIDLKQHLKKNNVESN